jgi:hypothetical protein
LNIIKPIRIFKNSVVEKISFLTKPNSFNHQAHFDLMYDAKNIKINLFLWKINNLFLKIISCITIKIIIFFEKFSKKKIENKKFFLLLDNAKRAFIFANGPSLNNFNTSYLNKNDKLFCCNSFYLTKISNNIKIDYYSIINTNWIKAIKDYPEKFDIKIQTLFKNFQKKFLQTNFIFCKEYSQFFINEIEDNLKKYTYINFSQIGILNYFPKTLKNNQLFPHPVDVSHFNLLLAFYLGFKEVIFVGLEHPLTDNPIYGHTRAHDLDKKKENEAFRGEVKFLEGSRHYVMGGTNKDLIDENTKLNNYWWQWYRSLNYFQTVKKLDKLGVDVFRYEDIGTLDFIKVKKF